MMSQLEFDAFYEFAFPRVYRFAEKRQRDAGSAQRLCQLILERALQERKSHCSSNPVELGFRLFSIARRVADEVDRTPELLSSAPGSSTLH